VTVDRIEGVTALQARAQMLADLQGRCWFVVSPDDGTSFATPAEHDISPPAEVVKLFPKSEPLFFRV
jgi:hypothetical protein